MKHLLMFTIGPVKEWIENSGKTMDLYAGSCLLSERMQKAMQWLNEKDNVTILFPKKAKEDTLNFYNMPNRLVAEFRGYTAEELTKTAKDLTDYVKQTFLQQSLELLKRAGIEKEGLDMASNQLVSFLEIYWLFEPFQDSNYPEVYQKLFTAIHAVKGIRSFLQTEEPWGRKCMLFPEYNAVFAKKTKKNGKLQYPFHVNPNYVYDITGNAFLCNLVKNKEAISAIALVKLVYSRESKWIKIYSASRMLLCSQVSVDVFKEAGIDMAGGEDGDNVADAVYDLSHDQVLTEEDYTPDIIQKAKCLYGIIKKYQITLSSYYAIVKFDGDSMGEVFRELKTAEEQKELGSKISRFAAKAPGILLENGGLPIFADGEDFLGLVPLKQMFSCMAKLHREFFDTIGLTFSAGIAIAHLMQPLKEVLEQADLMEQAAKGMDGKNAFVVGIMNRDGENVKMPAYKLNDNAGRPALTDVERMVWLLKRSSCSKSLFYQLSDLVRCFVDERVKPEIDMMEVLFRECVAGFSIEHGPIDPEELIEKLLLFYKQEGNKNDFLNALNGMVFLAREVAE